MNPYECLYVTRTQMKKQKMKQKSRKAPEKHHPTPVTIPPKGNHYLDFEFYKWNHILYTTFDSTLLRRML